jgi:hypothetical protein
MMELKMWESGWNKLHLTKYKQSPHPQLADKEL